MASCADVVGLLPCAPHTQHHTQHLHRKAAAAPSAAADLLGCSLFAYGMGASVAVCDVSSLRLAAVLAGGGHGPTVTAVKWCVCCVCLRLPRCPHVLLCRTLPPALHTQHACRVLCVCLRPRTRCPAHQSRQLNEPSNLK
jgi:hypothetical protein